MIVIEKNVPLVEARGQEKGKKKYPFAEMELGDSFLVRCSPTKEAITYLRETLGTSIRLANRTLKPKKFTQRTIRAESGIRVWRIE